MKKILAMALVLCMVLAMVPATAMAEETHTHCACAHAFTGLDADKCATHKEDQTWTAWDAKANANYKTTLPTTTGYYYLTEDVTINSQQVISANIHICTNGFDIISTKAADKDTVIRQFKSGSLTITNCKAQIKDGRLDTSDPAKTSTLSGGNTNSTNGGMLRADDTLPFNLYGVEFKDNQCTGSNTSGWTAGAILAVKRNNVDIAYCAFTNNKSTVNSGGAISLRGSNATIRNTTFTGNYAATNGGAIFTVTDTNEPNVTLKDCTFTGNGLNGATVTTNAGGAVYVSAGVLVCDNVSFSGNKVITAGGALYVNGGSAEAKNATSFGTNEAVGSGAGVYVNDGSFEATGVSFTGNKTTGTTNDTAGGAAIYMNAGDVTLTTVTITENENNGLHGSAITKNNGNLTLNNCSVTGNINKSNQNRAGIVVISNGGSTTVTGNTVITGNMNNSLEQNIFLRDTGSAETPKQPKLTVGALTSGAKMSIYTLSDLEPAAYLTATAQTPTFAANDEYLIYENRKDEADKTYGIGYNGSAFSYGVVGHYHADCACAIAGVTCKDHTSTEASKVLWKEWTGTDTLPTEDGYYYLANDVTLSKQWAFGTTVATTAHIRICTNGHDITSTGFESNTGTIRVSDNGTLTITNCKAQVKNGKLDTSDAAKTSSLSGGVTPSTSGGMLHINGNRSVKLYGVEFKNNESRGSNNSGWTGGAILATGGNNVTIDYCAFNNNRTTVSSGGAIGFRSAVADIRNTTFTGNHAATGGTIYIYGGGEVTLTNTTMTGNSNAGSSGSAITVENNSPTLTLNSCNITGNTNAGEGMRAAIVVIDSATFTVTGNTVVDNNTNKGVERNILLRNWSAQPKLTVGQLTEGANISVETADRTATVALEDPDTILTKNFTGDYQLGWISYSDGRSVGYNTTDGFYFVAAHTHDGVTYRPWNSTNALPQDGNYYLMANVTLNEAQKLSKATLKLCLNGKTVTGDVIAELGEAANLVVVSEGGALAGKLALAADSATVTSDCPIALELNGYDTIVNASNVTLTDSATDNGDVGGKVYGNCQVASNLIENGKIRYVILDSVDGTYKTANAVRVAVTKVNVRPSAAGIYYTTEFKFNKNVVDAGASYGVVLSLEAKPGADFMAGAKGEAWTVGAAPAAGENFVSTGNSCLVKNIFKDVTPEENAQRGATNIYANAYVKIGDTVIMAENANPVVYSMKTVMQALDTKVREELTAGSLSENSKKAMAFYETWQSAMSGWELDAMARENAKGEDA